MKKHSPILELVLQDAKDNAQKYGIGVVGVEDVCVALLINTFDEQKRTRCASMAVGDESTVLWYEVSKFGADLMQRVANLRAYYAANRREAFAESLLYSELFTRAEKEAEKEGKEFLTADVVLKAIFSKPTEAIVRFIRNKEVYNGAPAGSATAQSMAGGAEPQPAPVVNNTSSDPKGHLGDVVENIKSIRGKLMQAVFGQDNAINVLVKGLFKAEIADMTDKERRRPKATFLFAGPPGVGKTFLAEQTAKALQIPYKRFDMSEYSDDDSLVDFCGSDSVYKNSHPGLLTKFVEENPKCILLFDEIEKAHITIIHLFLQILDAGRCKDAHTAKEVQFKDAIIIFTTNAGKQLYEGTSQTNFADMSQKVIINALRKDVNPLTQIPYFPAAICSRFASGNVVMFNHIEAHDLVRIAKEKILHHCASLQENLGVAINIDERVYASVLFSEGGHADARTISSRAETFFDNELYELLRLVTAGKTETGVKEIESLNVDVVIPEDRPEIKELYISAYAREILVYCDEATATAFSSAAPDVLFHRAGSFDEAVSIIRSKDISAVLCDFYYGTDAQASEYLNIEDIESDGRSLFGYIRKNAGLPVYIIESKEHRLDTEEVLSLTREGARGIVDVSDTEKLRSQIEDMCIKIHHQQSMMNLARANKVVTYDTAQTLSADGKEASIKLFDIRLEVAVDAEDSNSILSNMSRPDVKLDDVLGAEDAKSELRYFIEYLRNPKKFVGTGVKAPRGLILYGPPGTGKTMLAKAMASESNATFITAEGNQFVKEFIGQGQKAVHDLFATARKYAPTILFIDEIDAIAKERRGGSSSGDSEKEATLTAFLSEMDGFSTDVTKPVFVLAATNFEVEPGTARSLDPALMRRFDRRVYIDLPTKADREKYLKMKIASYKAFDVSEDKIKNMAVRSTGMSLAQLESVIEMALRSSIRLGKDKITDDMFDEAFETFNNGAVKKWDEEQLERVARHESGHALLYWLSGDTPSYVTVVARGNHGGYMQHDDKEGKAIYTREELRARIRTSLGGRAAEILYYGEDDGISTGASGDLQSATNTAKHIICTYGMDSNFGLAVIGDTGENGESMSADVRAAVNEILKEEMENAIRILSENKSRIDALSKALIERSQLTGNEVVEIFSSVN